jgi:serine/threonine protein kinase
VSTVWNADTLIGTRLGASILERPLGIGGMGAVYLARQARPHRQVAVKVLRPQLAADPDAWKVFLARFRHEADATAALDHANIVPIYEFGEDSDLAYLVMPYLADGSLADLLTREGPLPPGRALAYLAQAAAALDYAHAHGIVHRDVKPSNLLLHPDGRLLLADFGIARITGGIEAGPDSSPTFSASEDASLTLAGRAMGTPQFMAPEQIRSESVAPAADIYALGMVAYAMLAGKPAFDGDTSEEVLRRQLYERPPRLTAQRRDLPMQMEEVLRWALAKSPAERPSSAGAFVRALKDASRGRTLGSTMASATSHSAVFPSATRANPASHYGPRTGPAQPSLDGTYGHNAQTVFDAGPAPRFGGFGAPPQWPGAAAAGGAYPYPSRPQRRRRTWLAIVAAAGVVVLLVVVLCRLASELPGGKNLGEPLGIVQPTPTATPTPRPTPTPTPPPNWLAVTPTHIALNCGTTKTVKVTLRNLGNGDTWWSADGPVIFGGISVDPLFGPLPSGNSITITITNNSVLVGHQDKLQFKPNNASAGDPAVLSYTTQPC